MRVVVPWFVSGCLALALLVQWQRAEDAQAKFVAAQSAVKETTNTYAELRELYATWLTLGLQHLRAGRSEDGFRALDTLLANTARSLSRDSEALEAANSYLKEVGDPWGR